MESIFLQSISHEGQEIPQALIITATFIEGIKLNAPKLIIHFADQDNDIADTFKITNGSELVVVMGDVSVESGDSFEDTFTVLSPPKKVGDTVLVEALQKEVYELKMHLNTPVFFVDKSPSQIFKVLVPNKKVNVLGNVGRGTFHIFNSVTPSMMLEQMAKELGAVVYYSRGEFFVVAYSYIRRKNVDIDYEYSNPKADNIIYGITTPFSENLIQRHKLRDYQMWHENDGIIKSGNTAPRQSIGNVGQDRLTSLNNMLLPVMISHCAGTTDIKPVTKIGFTLHRFNEELLVNESLPDEQVVIEIKHHQQGYKYICQITTGVLSE